jgi:plasmid stabilization system protein ParE
VSDYVLSSDADFDLDDIWEFIAADQIDAADRWIMPLKPLRARPASATSARTLLPYPVLFWTVGAYLIIYRAERRPVEIVAVTQGSRNIPAFLRRRLH